MPESIKLGVVDKGVDSSYINLYRQLENIDLVNEESFRKVFNAIQFNEEIGFEYNSLPIYVGWAYIPVVSDGLVEVKILKVEQGDGIAIILPERVATAYKELEDDITKLDTLNANLDLVGDVYGLDETDQELLELLKTLYINVGDKAEAFKLTLEGEQEYEELKGEDNNDDFETGGKGPGLGGGPVSRDNNLFGGVADSTPEPLEDLPEIDTNLEAYKRFRRDTDALDLFQEQLFRTTPKAVRDHITTGYIADDKLLVIRVDNKSIYETFNTLPKHARAQITAIGESIRLSGDTQLVDSFKQGNSRVFVLAENSHSNIWVVKDEENKVFSEKRDKTLYISNKNDIIELSRSSVRQENRRFIPRIKDDKVVFSVK